MESLRTLTYTVRNLLSDYLSSSTLPPCRRRQESIPILLIVIRVEVCSVLMLSPTSPVVPQTFALPRPACLDHQVSKHDF